MTTPPVPLVPGALADVPALIEKLLPVQKLSAEAYKEQMSVKGKTLTALGSYWKGRKPLILNRACLLGCLLPATDDPAADLAIFEQLLAMDDESMAVRRKRRLRPKELLTNPQLSLANIHDYFRVEPLLALPNASPIDPAVMEAAEARVTWLPDVTEAERRSLEARCLPRVSYREWVAEGRRPEEVPAEEDLLHHVWPAVNRHLGRWGVRAQSLPELVEQLGILRFSHRPRVADTFSGSGQIPFEAARLGCDVYASDLNPIACMLTWGAFNIVGGSPESREQLRTDQQTLARHVREAVDRLGIETDGQGWRAKVFLYCLEVRCPQTGWMVPLLPKLIISKGYRVVAELVPDPTNRRYDIAIRPNATDAQLRASDTGTVRSDGRGQDPYLCHTVDGEEYRTRISTLRGDYRRPDGTTANRLRPWERSDFRPRPDDLLQERLYCVQWLRLDEQGEPTSTSEFRAVTLADFDREATVNAYVAQHLA